MRTLNNAELAGTIRSKINQNFIFAQEQANLSDSVQTQTLNIPSEEILSATLPIIASKTSSNNTSLSSLAVTNFFPVTGGTLNTLTVQGSAVVNSQKQGQPTLTVNQGKVGINTSFPTEALSVSGNAFLPPTINYNQLRVGNCVPVTDGIVGSINYFLAISVAIPVTPGVIPGSFVTRIIPIYDSIQ